MAEIVPQIIVSGLLIGGVYALVSVGLSLLFGVVDIVNFAHGEFLMLGMYTTYWIWVFSGVDPLITLIISIPVMFLTGALLMKYLFKRVIDASPLTQIFLTVGLQILLQNVALMAFSANYRTIQVVYNEIVWNIGGVTIQISRLIAFFIAILLSIILWLFLTRTDMGKAMKASQLDRETAKLMGINTDKIFMIAAGISAAITGAAGTAISTFFYVFPTVGVSFGLMAYITVILGGLGNLKGAFVGGLLIGVAEAFGVQYVGADSGLLLAFIIFIVLLTIKPQGLFSKGVA